MTTKILQVADSELTSSQYVNKVLSDEAGKASSAAMDFCEAWSDDMPSADEIRSMRTQNTFPDFF